MADIKKIKINNTSYDIKDSSAVHTSDLATVATTGDYNDLTNKPTIPTIPTALSSFTDDLGTNPTHTHSQYLTQHQDISGKANISDLATVATSGDYDDLSNKPTIPTTASDIGALSTSGGTVNQNVTLTDNSATSSIKLKDSEISYIVNPSEEHRRTIAFTDNNDKTISNIDFVYKTNGATGIEFNVPRTVSGGLVVTYTLKLGIYNDPVNGRYIDFSDATDIQKQLTSFAFPSTSATTLFDSNDASKDPVPASTFTYTATDYGYVTFLHRTANAGGYIGLSTDNVYSYLTAHNNNQYLRVSVPVRKGATVTVEYSAASQTSPVSKLIFVKAGGVA